MPSTHPDALRDYPDVAWGPGEAGAGARSLEGELEAGCVLRFPRLRFELMPEERRFLDPRWTDGKAKNITLRPGAGAIRGSSGDAADQAALKAMMVRYGVSAQALVERLFPHYAGRTRPGNTTFRPVRLEGRVTSWRRDDSRLHIDAFPSNPTRGARLLRVFHNVNPDGADRLWRIGEPFRRDRRQVPSDHRPSAAWQRAAVEGAAHHQVAAHGIRSHHAAAARPHEGRCRIPEDVVAARPGVRPGHDLDHLQRPGRARGDGRPAHAGVHALARGGRPALA